MSGMARGPDSGASSVGLGGYVEYIIYIYHPTRIILYIRRIFSKLFSIDCYILIFLLSVIVEGVVKTKVGVVNVRAHRGLRVRVESFRLAWLACAAPDFAVPKAAALACSRQLPA